MIYLIIIVSCYLAFGLKFDYLSTQCPCSEYSQAICNQVEKCSWYMDYCVDLSCKNLIQNTCNGIQTNYQCIWDYQYQECKDFDYQNCEDITNESDCYSSYIINIECSWTINGTCKKLDCQIDQYCSLLTCSFINGICSNPTNELNCSAIPLDQCNYTQNGQGQFCYINDSGQCKSLDYLKFTCSLLNDSKSQCYANGCIYQDNQCRKKECSDISQQSKCKYIYDNQLSIVITCFWSNNSCQEIQENNLVDFSKDDCQIMTYFHYSWSENNECVECSLSEEEEESSQVLSIVLGTTIPIICIFTCFIIWWCRKKQKFCFKQDIKATRKSQELEIQKNDKKQLDNNFTLKYIAQQKPDY